MAQQVPSDAPQLADTLESLAGTLTQAAERLRGTSSTLDDDPKAKHGLIKAMKDTLGLVQSPSDQGMDMLISAVNMAALRLFMKWKVFDNLPADKSPITYEALAAAVGAEEGLIMRIAWVLVVDGILKQIGSDKIAHTDRSLEFSTNPLRAMIIVGFDDHLPSICAMPAYFAKHGLKQPMGERNTVYAWGQGNPDALVWDFIAQDKERMSNFMITMKSFSKEYPYLGSYDLKWAVDAASSGSPDRDVFVDMGGSDGHAMKAIAESAGLPLARCVLEDLPPSIAAVKEKGEAAGLGEAKLVGMDFHKEQPIKGALVYYIRRCLHDFSDDDCVGILKTTAEAMSWDSRLLIVEQVMHNPPLTGFAAAANVLMGNIGGKERIEEEFRDIAAKAGLRVTGVFRSEGTEVGVVECVKA